MVQVIIADEEMTARLTSLQRRAPKIFDKKIREFLNEGAHKIKLESLRIARREARGGTGAYVQGFLLDRIKREGNGDLSKRIYNRELYSMVIEYGGRWTKMPPANVLDQWISKIFGPKSKNEMKQISYAIRRAIKQNRHGGHGQKFVKSKDRTGRVFTMNRAMVKSQEFLTRLLSTKVTEGLQAI